MGDALDPGGWLKEQMERRKLTQRDVAQAVGLREQAVYYWLSNRTAPKDEAAAKLAALLDVPQVEVRRRFGLWVPEDGDPEPARSTAELEEIMRDLTAVLERFRLWRSGD
jgi:transcriptional regulator with XRE-family HTH domain